MLGNLASVFDASENWTAAGREYAASEAIAEATAMLDVIASSATVRAKDHMRQLDTELADIPPIDERRAVEIRGLLREMSKLDREAFITRADDPEILAAMVHGPRAFPLAGEQAVTVALRNINRTHRPDRVALRDDNETYITAIENFKEMVARQLRAALR